MARLFGTDGIRGIANIELTPELVYSIGFAHGYELRRMYKQRPRVVVGRDTRISGELLESAYASGLCAAGADVLLLGVIPTPAVAWYLTHVKAQGGGVISASHNPVKDNGIKLLGADGFKLTDSQEDVLEELSRRVDSLERPREAEVGRVYHCEQEAEDAYVEYLTGIAEVRLEGLRFVIDCANGASSRVAPRVFANLGAKVSVMQAEPDGLNINRDCGSTHMKGLQERVVAEKAQFGLAFDGDADRCLACDELGNIVDGDPLLLIFARYLRSKGELAANCLVTTVMANIGLEEALRSEGISMTRTAVGDRYVLAEMLKCGGVLGGEQSGHIIFLKHATTGDGVLTGLMLCQIMALEKCALSQLASACRKRPQLLVNVRVADKQRWREFPPVEECVRRIESELEGCGRLLVRPSGTENLLRLMAEGPDIARLEQLLRELSAVLNECCPAQSEQVAHSDSPDFAGLAQETSALNEELKKVGAILGRLSQFGDLAKIADCLLSLKDVGTKISAWSVSSKRMVKSLEGYAAREYQRRQLEFFASLRDSALEAGLDLSILTANPPEYRLGKFTVLPDFAGGSICIQYCRLAVAKVELEAAKVVAAVQKAALELEREDFKGEQFFADLLIAYKRRLILEGRALGERVNLVDLVPELAFQQQVQSAVGMAKKSSGVKKSVGSRRQYDVVQFAWDILRMWRELHGLECGGRRINLGTATINATKNKKSVLFLEEGGTHGQYYLSIWFTK